MAEREPGPGRVVVVGSLNIDLVARVALHPRPGQTVLGHDLRTLPGGKGANQAVAAARAGARVQLLGRVGDDHAGQRYRQGLRDLGIDVSSILPTPDRPTGAAHIAVDDAGENTIIVIQGANAEVGETDVDAWAEQLHTADVLLLQLETPMPAVVLAAELAAAAGVRVVLNASPPADVPEALLRLADPAVVNEHEADAVGSLPRSVCVTLGADGARWGEHTARPPEVAVVDTTGAGDSFAGTLAAHLARRDSEAEALRAAVQASSQATTWSGAQGWTLP